MPKKRELPGRPLTEERLEVLLSPELRAEVYRCGDEEGISASEFVVRTLCEKFCWPLWRGLRPRRRMGRPPKAPKKK